ncbi:nuclear transport factor 2 family protein [Allorhizobium terrae]|uniref:Nuclear transport factor 2 family protein n=1 Tax=Allorhizobium terrae TaxID=1848972 RepID=A0A4S3ZUU7_9HYPH|nr:nuclear transport factor 2 family protein [Allorhizobium terrae]THF49361.1 nuclear transport factor 2 family protein [Allorhizobium terrae]
MTMPTIVASYFEADHHNDADALIDTFTTDAVVDDEQSLHQGKDAIRIWWTAAKQASQFVVAPLDVKTESNVTQVRASVSGAFAGSPITLTHTFTITNGKIAKLEIK